MTGWKLRIEERAEAEARAAFFWYLAPNERAAERFQTAVEESISLIAENVASSPELEPGIRRRLILHRFPYAIIYRILGDEIHVLAVAHLRRRPGYWRR